MPIQSRWTVAITVFVVLLFIETMPFWFHAIPFFKSWHMGHTLATARVVLVMFALLALTGKLDDSLNELGLFGNPIVAVIFALIATIPMWGTLALTSPVSQTIDPGQMIAFDGLHPISEEVFYRGFAFGLLFRRVGLGFWFSAILPAVLFAAGHLYQAHELGDAVATIAITGLAALLFSWLFMMWNFNLWIPIAMHIFMNSWWDVFSVGEGAFAGWVPTVMQFGCAAAAIVITLFARRAGWLPKSTAAVKNAPG